MDVDIAGLQKRLGIKRVKRPDMLAQAMVHRSYVNEASITDVDSNERLEFLGDAVLGCVIARWLFERYPEVNEGRLTELRAYLVRGETLSVVADRLGLGEFLVLGRGEEATGGRRRPMNLARGLEAVIGALYLACGFKETQAFVLRAFRQEFKELGAGDLPRDAKSQLQQVAQMVFGRTPQYRTVSAEGPDHAKTFTIEVVVGDRSLGTGTGRTKQIAQVQAAQEALARIESEEKAAQPDGRSRA